MIRNRWRNWFRAASVGVAALPWAYYTLMNPFDPSPVLQPSAKAHEDSECYDCHKAHASKDNVWVQFYPTLRKLVQ